MSSPILSKLRAVRRKHGLVALLVALTTIVGIVFVCLGGGMAADRWLELRYGWRAVLLSVYGCLVVWSFYRLAVLALWHGPNLEQAALWVEREEPVFKSRLISTVQFLKPADDFKPGSPAMVRHVITETEKIAGPIRFTRVVRTDRLRRLAMIVAFAVVAVVGGAVYAGSQSIPLLQRALLVPGIPIPRRTQIQIVNPNQTIARGDTVTLTAIASGVVPASGTVRLIYDTGESADFSLVASGSTFSRTIGNVQGAFTYTVYLGDNQLAGGRVRVVLRPAVLDVRCVQIFPRYTGHPDEEKKPWDLSLLTGSRLKIAVKSSMPGKASPDLNGCRVRLAGSDLVYPLVGSINDLTELHAVDGTKSDIPIPAGTTGFSVELLDDDGVWSDDPTLHKIALTNDLPPTVKIVSPENSETTVTPVAKQSIEIEANDDYGVGRLDLKYRITRAGATTADQADPHGLAGTYFSDPQLVGNSVERVDPSVDLNWASTPPPPGIAPPAFGVRWTGYVRPVYGEPTQFFTQCGDGCRLWVNGNQVIDQWTHGGQADSKPIVMEPGQSYAIRLEVRSTTPAGKAYLGWRSPRMQPSAVPHSSLFHVRPPDPSPDVAGLVNAWPCDDQTAGFVHDRVGNANGVVYNAKRTDGPNGPVLLFDEPLSTTTVGLKIPIEKAEIESTPSMRFQATDSFTLTARAEVRERTPESNPLKIGSPWQAIVLKSRDQGAYYGIWIDPQGRWSAASQSQMLTGSLASPGWHYVALVQDGSTKSRVLYVDGQPVATGRAENADGWGPMVFGNLRSSNSNDPVEPFYGSVSDVRLYGRAVPADQIKAMADNPKPLPQALDVVIDPNAADTIPIAVGDKPPTAVKSTYTLDLSTLPAPPAVGDTIEFWAEAADTNDASGPGVATSEHYQLKVISAADKQKELLDKLGDYLGQIHNVSDDQRDLTTKVGTLAKPEKK